MSSADLPAAAAGPSLYEFVRDQLDPAGRLSDPGMALPDEQRGADEMRWAPGALDGVTGHHGGAGGEIEHATRLADAFERAAAKPTRRRLLALYELVDDPDVLAWLDPLIEELARRQVDRTSLHRLGRWLATTAAARGAVKVGIAMLGASGLGDDVVVARVLGAHEEFTLYAAVAMTNGLEDPDTSLWALAASVDGWGRIQCVERLKDTQDPTIRDWILREGFRNSIMHEYLAHLAATTGGLLVALEEPEPDRELLTAAGEILQALIAGGPAEDLDDYADGADAVGRYLEHLTTRASTTVDVLSVAAIRRFLDQDGDWEERAHRGWTATRREAFEERCRTILARPEWGELVASGLRSDDDGERWRADAAAEALDIDTFDFLIERLRRDPLGHEWYRAWKQADSVRAEELVDLVRTRLRLDELGSGAADALGIGPEWRAHSAFDWTLQALRDHPGVGGDLLLVGLRSPVVRGRNMALMALKEWPEVRWPPGARAAVEAVAESDPRERVREFAAEVLADP